MNEFVQYWVNQDGVQAGPVTRDEMATMSLTSNAYVWRSGLEDWVKITQLPELEGVYQLIAPAAVPPLPGEAPDAVSSAAETSEAPTAGADSADEPPVGQPVAPVMGNPVAPVMGEPLEPRRPDVPQAAMPQAATGEVPECPPTNLVWAILATVLCCIPLGIVAIVYANKVSRLYYEGDLAGARRASETGAWWCIAAIIMGIIAQPFLSLIQMAAMG